MNINLNPFPILTTARLTLRQLNIEDSAELMQLRSNDRVNAYLDRDKPTTIDDIKSFINKIDTILQNNEGVYWVITLSGNDSLIGTICYWNLDIENNTAEIGYELHPDYHGQGIMQEAIKTVIEYGFEIMQVKEITAFPRADNTNSIKLLERNGFELGFEDNAEPDNYLKYWLKAENN